MDRARTGKQAEDGGPDVPWADFELAEQSRSQASRIHDEGQKDVFGAGALVLELDRLVPSRLERPLRARRQREVARLRLGALADVAHDLLVNLVVGHVERVERARGDTFRVAEESEEYVVRTDLLVTQRASLGLRRGDRLSTVVGEPIQGTEQRTATVAAFRRSVRTTWSWTVFDESGTR